MDHNERFTEEALKAQDGKKVPFTRELGGPVIGEVTLRYDPGAGALIADIKIDDVDAGSGVIFKKES
jgi:hypothetical protein